MTAQDNHFDFLHSAARQLLFAALAIIALVFCIYLCRAATRLVTICELAKPFAFARTSLAS
jgi:hypothetical protein